MNLQEGIDLINAVRDFEKVDDTSFSNEKTDAAQDLVKYITDYVLNAGRSGGWEREISQFIDKKEPEATDAYEKDGDLYVGRWRVHLVHDGELDGCGNVYPGWFAKRALGLPMVEFYDMSQQDPVKFPNGRFTNGQCMSDMLGIGIAGDISIEYKNVIHLGYPFQPLRGDALKVVTKFVCEKHDALIAAKASPVSLKTAAKEARAASEKLAEGRVDDSPARDDHSIV